MKQQKNQKNMPPKRKVAPFRGTQNSIGKGGRQYDRSNKRPNQNTRKNRRDGYGNSWGNHKNDGGNGNWDYEGGGSYDQNNHFTKFIDPRERERQRGQNQNNWMRFASPRNAFNNTAIAVPNEVVETGFIPPPTIAAQQQEAQHVLSAIDVRQNANDTAPLIAPATTVVATDVAQAPLVVAQVPPVVAQVLPVVAQVPPVVLKQEIVKTCPPSSSSSSSSSSEEDDETPAPAAVAPKQPLLQPSEKETGTKMAIQKNEKPSNYSSSDEDSSSEDEEKKRKAFIPKVAIKTEQTKESNNKIVKKTPTSSSSSSSSEDEAPAPAAVAAKLVPPSPKPIINNPSAKLVKNEKGKDASSSSSSEEDSSSEEEGEDEEKQKPISAASKKHETTSKESMPDVVCLGELENKFTIEDDEEVVEEKGNEDQEQEQDLNSHAENALKETYPTTDNQCGICEKMGHASFQCQMVCKNCALPYHNMKSCPRPANLTVMLQSFMEFCMQQMNHYNPEQRFPFSNPYSGVASAAGYPTPSSPTVSSGTFGKRSRTAASKYKDNPKKSSKKKHRKSKNRSYDQQDEDEEDETATTSDTTPSDSDSESSIEREKPTSTKHKKKRTKTAAVSGKETAFAAGQFALPAGVAPYAALPNFGAAAGYNPLLFSQMMHGAFPAHVAMNFKS